MAASYTAEERRRLAEAEAQGEALRCPVCGAAVARRPVVPEPGVAYVRRRVWLICPECKRSAALDVRSGGRP